MYPPADEDTMAPSSTNSLGSPVPVFRVQDVDASIAYFSDALGFELRWRAGKDFACVVQGKCSIFLTDDNQSQPRMWIWIGVEDVRALHARYLAPGAKIRSKTWTAMCCASAPIRRRSSHWASGEMRMGSAGGIWAMKRLSALAEQPHGLSTSSALANMP
jgi:hypothetical protein